MGDLQRGPMRHEGRVTFEVVMGEPEMRKLWNALKARAEAGTLNREQRELAKKFAKEVKHLGADPYHPGLQSDEISDLTKRVGRKVFESYLENDTPSAGRLYWVFGPAQGQIAVLALEPHPDDANGAYGRVQLSTMPSPLASTAPSQMGRHIRGKQPIEMSRTRHTCVPAEVAQAAADFRFALHALPKRA